MKQAFTTVLLLSTSLVAFGQTREHKKTPSPSHRMLLLSRLNIAEVQFKVSCAKNADHSDNQTCTHQMLQDLQSTYRTIPLLEIPVPEKYQPTEIVFVFKEDALMDGDTLTLTVYETENNDELYSDSRSVLILGNDLTKLLAGYVQSLE